MFPGIGEARYRKVRSWQDEMAAKKRRRRGRDEIEARCLRCWSLHEPDDLRLAWVKRMI